MKRIDLIVARYEKNQDNGIESLDLKVIQGTPAESNPAAPQYTEGNIQAGDYVADMPMYQVIIEGLNITEVKKMFKVIGSNKDLSNKISNMSNKISNTSKRFGNVKRMYGGSTVLNAGKTGTSRQLFSDSEINSLLGVSNSSNANTAIAVSNGDGAATGVHVEGCTYQNGTWNVVFNTNIGSGPIRINYIITYWG